MKAHNKFPLIFSRAVLCLILGGLSNKIYAIDDSLSHRIYAYTEVSSQSNLKDISFPLYRRSLISSGFGFRNDPFTGEYRHHSGVDIAAKFGSSILAASNGYVSFVGYLPGYGNLIEITHGQGYITRYGHADRFLVRNGEYVMSSQIIGFVGATGKTTGPHLHFEVKYNQQDLDPMHFFISSFDSFIQSRTAAQFILVD